MPASFRDDIPFGQTESEYLSELIRNTRNEIQAMIPDQKKDDATALDIVEETQDFEAPKPVLSDEIKVGDKVVHTKLFISVCRGAARERAKVAVMECIGITPRSVMTRPWGTTQKYGSQYERRYIRKAD